MIQEPSHTKLLDSKLPEEHTEASKRLKPPKGSIPASGCQTRGAVLATSAVTNTDTASPLPDQGWVSPVMAVRDKMLKEAAAHRKMAKIESNPVTFMERRRHYQGAADGLVAYASMLKEAVGEIRTQSVADGDEPEAGLIDRIKAHLRALAAQVAQADKSLKKGSIMGDGCLKGRAFGILMAIEALDTFPPQVSRKERSVSGNANVDAPAHE